jgi:hypothetical protein
MAKDPEEEGGRVAPELQAGKAGVEDGVLEVVKGMVHTAVLAYVPGSAVANVRARRRRALLIGTARRGDFRLPE